ncbi:MAG: arsenate reductase ArsC [Planctomycetota bacterium]|nr:MAG: arsenate reductase ArsC [Planctomycetota bacterium]
MSTAKDEIKVLFVCTGNSCRSQIAEGWASHLKSDSIDAYSAGIRPIGVSPRAAKVMAEVGVDISNQASKHIDDLGGIDFDYVVTLCDNASEQCPVFGGGARLIHRAFEDPYFATGSEEEVMAAFRKSRDDIRAFIETLPEALQNEDAQ